MRWRCRPSCCRTQLSHALDPNAPHNHRPRHRQSIVPLRTGPPDNQSRPISCDSWLAQISRAGGEGALHRRAQGFALPGAEASTHTHDNAANTKRPSPERLRACSAHRPVLGAGSLCGQCAFSAIRPTSASGSGGVLRGTAGPEGGAKGDRNRDWHSEPLLH